MAWARPTWDERGQATVEHVGLTLIVALLLAACAAWVAQEMRPPARLPDVIGRVAAPLEGLDVHGAVPHGGPPPYMRVPPSRQGQPGMLHSAWDAFLAWGTLNVDGELQAAGGFVDEVRARAEQAVRDPLGTGARILGMLRGVPMPAPPSAGDDPDEPGVMGYLFDAGKRPFRDTFLHMSRVAGRWAADWLITRGAKWLRTRLPSAVTGR